ncbi:MAG: alpha/beta hydrolase [Chloroflexi bacterium]|nr:alpha/beta hydrolase [Chloroflexota bacterium]MBM4452457.1 alpha/beta hydrolase [Chloroflexota bacterium]
MSAKKGTGLGKWAWITIAIVLAVLLIPTAIYIAADREKKTLDEAARQQLGGSYVTLSNGVTHYQLAGPKDGDVVVLVHGATIPMWIWDPQVEALTRAGFQVLRYDLYGRGYSDRPAASYDRQFYRKQLLELLDNLDIKKPVDLAGMSLGGAIATDFTANYPDRVRSLVLFAPVVNSVKKDTSIKMLRIPVMGDFLMRLVATKSMTKRASALVEGMSNSEQRKQSLQEQITYEGFERAALSMFRGDVMRDCRDAYRAVGKQDRKVLLVWGTEDSDISRDMIDEIQKAIPGVQLYVLEGVGHQLNIESVQKVNEAVIDFLKK